MHAAGLGAGLYGETVAAESAPAAAAAAAAANSSAHGRRVRKGSGAAAAATATPDDEENNSSSSSSSTTTGAHLGTNGSIDHLLLADGALGGVGGTKCGMGCGAEKRDSRAECALAPLCLCRRVVGGDRKAGAHGAWDAVGCGRCMALHGAAALGLAQLTNPACFRSNFLGVGARSNKTGSRRVLATPRRRHGQ